MNKERNKIIANNIRKYLKETQMTQKQLAELIDIKPSTLSDYMNLRSNPSHGVIQKIADVFGIVKSDIDTTYKESNDITTIYSQLTLPRRSNVLSFAQKQLDEQNKVTSIGNYKENKLYPIELYGATGAGVGEELYDDIVSETLYFNEEDIPPQADFCILINGDSMEPIFKMGTYAFIEKKKEVKDQSIALVVLNGTALIKKFEKCDDCIKLVSLNQNYKDIIVKEHDHLNIVGKVVM